MGWPFNQKHIFYSPLKNHPEAVKSYAFKETPHDMFFQEKLDIWVLKGTKSLKQVHEGACSSRHWSATTLHISHPVKSTDQTREGPEKLGMKKLSLGPWQEISNQGQSQNMVEKRTGASGLEQGEEEEEWLGVATG